MPPATDFVMTRAARATRGLRLEPNETDDELVREQRREERQRPGLRTWFSILAHLCYPSLRHECEINAPHDTDYSLLTTDPAIGLCERRMAKLPRSSPTIEAGMRALYQSLSEKDRRRYEPPG
jgi:hypothetical protein